MRIIAFLTVALVFLAAGLQLYYLQHDQLALLLKLFLSQADRVLTHHWLLQRVWGPEYGTEGNYLHVYVAGLRKKLEENPKRPQHLLTRRR